MCLRELPKFWLKSNQKHRSLRGTDVGTDLSELRDKYWLELFFVFIAFSAQPTGVIVLWQRGTVHSRYNNELYTLDKTRSHIPFCHVKTWASRNYTIQPHYLLIRAHDFTKIQIIPIKPSTKAHWIYLEFSILRNKLTLTPEKVNCWNLSFISSRKDPEEILEYVCVCISVHKYTVKDNTKRTLINVVPSSRLRKKLKVSSTEGWVPNSKEVS